MIKWHYQISGNPQHSVVLFLHGFLGDRTEFDAIELPYRRLSVDLPGHGATSGTGDFAATAIALLDLLDTLNIAQADLIGYSMGGRLALYLALTFPDHFPRAVLESASPGLQTESERQTRIQHDEALALQIATNFPGFLQQWYEQPLFDSFRQHPQFAQKLKARSQQSPIALAQSLRHLSTGRQPNLWEKLQVHNQPLLLLVGERDRKFVTINRMMQQQCPTATLAVLPNLGHNLHFEDPLTYQQVVQDFLENSMHR